MYTPERGKEKMKTKKKITIEWEIHDTRENHTGFRTGTSTLIVENETIEEDINDAIQFADSLPSWELERNNIDEQDYREGNVCRYYYRTQLSKIVKIEKYVEEGGLN